VISLFTSFLIAFSIKGDCIGWNSSWMKALLYNTGSKPYCGKFGKMEFLGGLKNCGFLINEGLAIPSWGTKFFCCL